ncbi:hypothetical protein S7335_664 [Synechococcus sp. PCC 7335]|nr:hypothetical protein S7335_664 [Synechococcus sp. PCC 7335]
MLSYAVSSATVESSRIDDWPLRAHTQSHSALDDPVWTL